MAQVLAQNHIASRPLSANYFNGRKQQGLLLGFAAFDEEMIDRVASGLRFLHPFVDRRSRADRQSAIMPAE